MQLFGRTPGYYLFWAGAIYVLVGVANAFLKLVDPTLLSIAWILCLMVPLTFKSVADYFNMSTIWDQLKPKKAVMNNHTDNVYNLPTPKAVPTTPEPEVEKKEEPAKIYYRLGLTDNNRVAFSMGYSEITMSHAGCQQMIDQLTFFQSQLYDEDDTSPDDDPDGGEPVPVPEQKAA